MALLTQGMNKVLAQPIAVLESDDHLEELRLILAQQQEREVGRDEAREIGSSLLEFFQILADGVHDERVE
jgi:hypothetical protein